MVCKAIGQHRGSLDEAVGMGKRASVPLSPRPHLLGYFKEGAQASLKNAESIEGHAEDDGKSIRETDPVGGRRLTVQGLVVHGYCFAVPRGGGFAN